MREGAGVRFAVDYPVDLLDLGRALERLDVVEVLPAGSRLLVPYEPLGAETALDLPPPPHEGDVVRRRRGVDVGEGYGLGRVPLDGLPYRDDAEVQAELLLLGLAPVGVAVRQRPSPGYGHAHALVGEGRLELVPAAGRPARLGDGLPDGLLVRHEPLGEHRALLLRPADAHRLQGIFPGVGRPHFRQRRQAVLLGELLRDVRLAGEVVFREMPFPARLRVERVDADVRVGYSLQALLQALVVVVVVDDGGRRSGAERLHHPLLRVRPERVQIDAVLGVWREHVVAVGDGLPLPSARPPVASGGTPEVVHVPSPVALRARRDPDEVLGEGAVELRAVPVVEVAGYALRRHAERVGLAYLAHAALAPVVLRPLAQVVHDAGAARVTGYGLEHRHR